MRTRAGLGVWLITPLICAALLGCAIVDQYSGRAIVYNLEAEQAQDQEILLNIVRASLQRPMQFTTVSTITGVATASASTQYTLPTNVPFRPPVQGATGVAAFPPLPTWLLSGSVSGGPVFTVPVLDTQEFYEGILKAIPGQLWDLYIQANYPPDLLFNLFVEKVVMKRIDGDCSDSKHLPECEFEFINSVTTGNIQIDLFQTVANYLLALGLTTARPQPETVPVKDINTQNINVRYVGAEAGTDDKRTTRVIAPPGGSTAADAQSSAGQYKVCFAPHDDQLNGCIDSGSLCDASEKEESPPAHPALSTNPVHPSTRLLARHAHQMCGNLAPPEPRASSETGKTGVTGEIRRTGSASVNIFASDEFISNLLQAARDDESSDAQGFEVEKQLEKFFSRAPRDSKKAVALKITIYMRHTEGMVYYVGSLVRRSLGQAHGWDQRDIYIRLDRPYETHRQQLCRESADMCAYIFRLHVGSPQPGDIIAVNYAGQSYSIPGLNSSQPGLDSPIDLSSLTFDFLKQLIALNSSAKSLPQSSVVTTVGGQ
jgi:hypothetical protein